MLKRRSLLTLTAATALATVPGLRAFADAAADRAESFVRATGDQLVSIVNGPGTMPEKRQKLQRVIDNTVDVDGVARFSLGRYWRTASPEQQKQFTALFHDVLLNNISGKLGDYQGVRFTVNRTTAREETQVINTTVERPNNQPTAVDWIISQASGSPKIVDVVAEGTSLRLTQRSDYAAYLARNNNNVQALIDAMRQQISQSG